MGTPSERRVAGLAGEGMTKRELAQALFVTQRTVEQHLGNAFRTLDIGLRTEPVGALPEMRTEDAGLPSETTRERSAFDG